MTNKDRKLANAQKMHDLLSCAISYLDNMEDYLEEGVLTEEQEDSILDFKDNLGDLLYEIQERITELEFEE